MVSVQQLIRQWRVLVGELNAEFWGKKYLALVLNCHGILNCSDHENTLYQLIAC